LKSVETEINQFDGMVDMRLLNGISEVELSHSLRNTDDGQQSSWSNVCVAQIFISVSLELSFLYISSNDVVV
jgi:hypothetical protein